MNISAEMKEYNENTLDIDTFPMEMFDIVHTEKDGDCAIHTLLEGLKQYYSEKKIINIINSLINEDKDRINVLLRMVKKNIISYIKPNIIAFRTALYNYYIKNKSEEKVSIYSPSLKDLETMKEGYYLQDKDFYHICKIFKICIYLRTHIISGGKTENKWIKINPMKTTRCIYINHIDLIHWELLKLKQLPIKSAKERESATRLGNKTLSAKTISRIYPNNSTESSAAWAVSISKGRNASRKTERAEPKKRSRKTERAEPKKHSLKANQLSSIKTRIVTNKTRKSVTEQENTTPFYNIAMGIFFFIIIVGVSY